jgi:hypothetical protein
MMLIQFIIMLISLDNLSDQSICIVRCETCGTYVKSGYFQGISRLITIAKSLHLDFILLIVCMSFMFTECV